MYYHNKSSENSYSNYKDPNSSTKVDTSYINYIPHWMLDKCKEYEEKNTIGRIPTNRGVDVSLWPKSFPEQHLVLTHYMLSLWWMNFLTGLVHYLIQPGAVDQVMVMTTSLVDMSYTYTICRMKKTPDIIVSTINLVWLSTWTTSIISCTISH